MARLPVVATRSGGAAEIIADDVTGRWVRSTTSRRSRRRCWSWSGIWTADAEWASGRVPSARGSTSLRIAFKHARAPPTHTTVALRSAGVWRRVRRLLLYAPSIIAKPLRRWGLHRVWHAVNHSRQRASS